MAKAHTREPDVEKSRLLIEQVLRTIVRVPDEVAVRAAVSEGTTVFRIQVAREDISRVVGNDGRTVHALRMILGAVGLRYNQRFMVEIEEYLE